MACMYCYIIIIMAVVVLLLALTCLTLYHRHVRGDSSVYKQYLIMLQGMSDHAAAA